LTPAPALADVSDHDPGSTLTQLLDAVRGHAESAAAHTKQHAASLAARVSDPTPLAGARPGAAAAAIAGCIALGGGAYCAVHGLPDPIKPVFGLEHHWPKPKPKRPSSFPDPEPANSPIQPAPRQPARTAPAPKPAPTPISKPTPTPSPPPPASAPQPKSQVPPPPPKQSPPTPPPSEFFGQSAPPARTARASPSPPRSPAPATSQGEFDGP
jgi:hypothetical protein